ncbi:MAG: hypothetical protein ACFFCW_33725, partial [Candidatus Hodarchaeota archaeon]
MDVICLCESLVSKTFCLGWVVSSGPNKISPFLTISSRVSGVREKPVGGMAHGFFVIGWMSG